MIREDLFNHFMKYENYTEIKMECFELNLFQNISLIANQIGHLLCYSKQD